MLVKSAPGSEMAGREDVLKRRKKAKFLWTHFGKGVLNAIEENIDPEFAGFYFDDYTAEASRVLELCKELATYDKDDSLEETENVVFMENIQKQTETIIFRYKTYRQNFKENATRLEEGNTEDDYIETGRVVKRDNSPAKTEIKRNEVRDENVEEGVARVEERRIEVKNKENDMSGKINISDLEWKDSQIESNICDVTLAGDERHNWAQKMVISPKSDEGMLLECVSEENIVEMDTDLYYEKYILPEIVKKVGVSSDTCIIETDSGDYEYDENLYCGASIKEEIEETCQEIIFCEKRSEVESIVDDEIFSEVLIKEETFPDFKEATYPGQSKKEEHVATSHEKCICEYCGKHFKKRISLRNHVETVHEGSPESCNQCDKRMSQVIKLNVETYHEEFILCEKCEKCFKIFKSLQNHDEITNEVLLYYYFRRWSRAKKRKKWLKETNRRTWLRGKNRRTRLTWKKIKWLMKRSLSSAGGLYDFGYLVCLKCGHQHLIVNNVTPNHYCSNCLINSRKQVCDTVVTNPPISTKMFPYASVTDDD